MSSLKSFNLSGIDNFTYIFLYPFVCLSLYTTVPAHKRGNFWFFTGFLTSWIYGKERIFLLQWSCQQTMHFENYMTVWKGYVLRRSNAMTWTYQGEQNAVVKFGGQERLSGRAAKQSFIKTMNSFAALYCCHYWTAYRRRANNSWQ